MVSGTVRSVGWLVAYFVALVGYYTLVDNWAPGDDAPAVHALAALKPPYPQHLHPRTIHTSSHAIVTVIWSDAFVLPALVLFRSLRMYGTKVDLVVLVPDDPSMISAESRAAFLPLKVRVHTFPTDVFPATWSPQFYKFHAFQLTEYKQVLMVDADTLAVTNIDDVFETCTSLGADVCASKNPGSSPTSRLQAETGMRRYFNGGMLVFRPDLAVFDDMVAHVDASGTCCKWAFEQDFFNWYMWGKHGLFAAKTVVLLPWGHFNAYPATHLIHFVRGKPWYWWAYPLPFPGTPTGHVWGAVSSFQWAYVRATLPLGSTFFGGFFSGVFLRGMVFPIVILCAFLRHAEIVVRRAHLGKRMAMATLGLWALLFACAGRDCSLGLVPDRTPPQLAWLIVAALTGTTAWVAVAAGGGGTVRGHTRVVVVSRRGIVEFAGGTGVLVIVGVSFLAVVRFFHPALRPWKAWCVCLSLLSWGGRALCVGLWHPQKDRAALPKYL
jgi:hypothetical protein